MRRQAGDTLIEVTLALAILSVILVSSSVLINQAFAAGESANQRSVVSNLLQQQAEELRNFRDANIGSWCGSFYDPISTLPPSGFHMALSGSNWLPVGGSDQSQPPFVINTQWSRVPDPTYPDGEIEFDITATWPAHGGGPANTETISTYLADLDKTATGQAVATGACP